MCSFLFFFQCVFSMCSFFNEFMDRYMRCERHVVSCFFFKIIDRRMLGVLCRTREECRFSRSSFHSEGASFREDPRWRGYLTWKGTMDYTVKSQISSLSVYIYRAEWSGASKGFRFLNTPAYFLLQPLEPCQWRGKLLFFPLFLLFSFWKY